MEEQRPVVRLYQKSCKICKKDYEHAARNSKYCEKCSGAPAKAKAKTRQRKRRIYSQSQEIGRLLSRAYKLSQDMALLFLEKECTECGEKDITTLELHHRDCNPFHVSPDNLQWLCRKHHETVQAGLPKINTLVFLTKALNDFRNGVIDEEQMLRLFDQNYGLIFVKEWKKRRDAYNPTAP